MPGGANLLQASYGERKTSGTLIAQHIVIQ